MATSLVDMNNSNTDLDGDGASNNEESLSGSDPYSIDTDLDGIKDGDELHLTLTDVLDWDSDNDEISDYDDFRGYSGITYPGGVLPHSGSTYYDYDGDGLKNPDDPAPQDPDNLSAINQVSWYGWALGDADGDGIANFSDVSPYPDLDGDGLFGPGDPAPSDPQNYSPYNGYSWPTNAFGDADSDGVSNWYDSSPFPDVDGDGLIDNNDPFPNDAANYSSTNGVTWYGNVLNDDDGDTLLNWNDPAPDVPADDDSDGVPNTSDPYPGDLTNYSSINGQHWYAQVLGDADGDGDVNWHDPSPLPAPDEDSDGIADGMDPFPNDSTNYSSINLIYWYGDVLGDLDGDGVLNWQDAIPNGNGDTDGDGIIDSMDPVINDPNNFSPINNSAWGTAALGDADGDGEANWYDSTPSPPADSDGDSIPDNVDPFPYDFENYSAINNTAWYQNVLGDADSDGIVNPGDPFPNDQTNYSYSQNIIWYDQVLFDADADGVPNWQDSWPYYPYSDPEVDADGDGLPKWQEYEFGLDDSKTDCDDDELTDYEELLIYHSDPKNAYDLSEELGWGQLYEDYFLVAINDTDGDGIPDRIEVHYGLDPQVAADAQGDIDGNGVNNLGQYQLGRALNGDLAKFDADLDGMSDIFELHYNLTAGFSDAVLDPDGDGVLNYEESQLGLSPLNPDSRGIGGLGDLQVLMAKVLYPLGVPNAADNNQNGVPDWADAALIGGSPKFVRVLQDDLDGDGMQDMWEHGYGRWLFPANGLQLRIVDSDVDADLDELSNLQEMQLATHPLISDTDNNGIDDGDEDLDGDTLGLALELLLGFDPWQVDSDNDGTIDSDSPPPNDPDRDGLMNAQEAVLSRNPQWKDHPAVGLMSTGVSLP